MSETRTIARVAPRHDSVDDSAIGDELLLARFAAGDSQAFDALYRRHQGPLYRFVRRLMGVDQAASVDEVFQDTWLKVMQAAPHWRAEQATVRTWLFTIAHHRCIDVLRRSGRELSVESDALAPFDPAGEAWAEWPAPDSVTDPQELSFWRAAGVRLLDCLERLPVAQRAIFLLHSEDGVALEQAAQQLQIGFETAKSRLRYAMTKLRMCMGAYLPGSEQR